MPCQLFSSIRHYFQCCFTREYHEASQYKKDDNEIPSPLSDTGRRLQTSYSFDELSSTTPKTASSSSSWSFSSNDDLGMGMGSEPTQLDLSQRIQSHNRTLFLPYACHTYYIQ